MKVCIIGNGLVSLTLANVLTQKDLFVDILSSKKSPQYHKSRTLGISKSNIDYFNQDILNIKKILWNINKIKIFTEKDPKNEILKFKTGLVLEDDLVLDDTTGLGNELKEILKYKKQALQLCKNKSNRLKKIDYKPNGSNTRNIQLVNKQNQMINNLESMIKRLESDL